MINFLGKAFTVLVSILSILVLIAGPVCGYFAAKYYVPNLIDVTHPTLVTIGIVALGLVIALIFDIVVFGLVAQVISIKKDLDVIKDGIFKE